MNKQYLKDEEQKLLSKNTKFNIEREILSTLSKEDFLEIIDMKAMALKTRKMFYGYRINNIKNSYRYKKPMRLQNIFSSWKNTIFENENLLTMSKKH